MISRFTLVILVSAILMPLSAQEDVKIKKKEFKGTEKNEGFKEAWKSIQNANGYYDDGRGTYDVARDHYLFANQYNGFNPELNYKIGVCYLFSDDKAKALEYFLTAFELKPNVAKDIRLLIGRAYHLNEEFDNARKFYLDYKQNLLPEEITPEISKEVEKYVIECAHGKEFTKEPERVILQNLGPAVNSEYDDYNPRFAFQDTALYFTTRRPITEKSKRSELDNKFHENAFVSPIEGGEFKSAYMMQKPFMDKGHNAIVAVSPEGKYLLIYDGGSDGGDIMMAEFDHEKSKWKKPKSISKDVGGDYHETTAAISPDGNKLYFISDDPELSNGGKDIFVSRLTEKGKWGEPENLGGLLNTKYDEEGVFLTDDGMTLYFSSKGHNSMGGFDVFRSDREEDGTWKPPVNIGYPVNTPEDEVFYVTDSSGVYGYYSTIREGGLGGKDIYRVVYLGSEKEVVPRIHQDFLAGAESVPRDPFLTYPDVLPIDTALLLNGYIRDTISIPDTVIVAQLTVKNPEDASVIVETISNRDGFYSLRIPEPRTYAFELNAPGYIFGLEIVDLSGHNPDEPATRDFYLQKLEVGTKVILDNIYFETGKSVLTPDSYEALDQVVKFLESNGTVRLEISGHTDNTGSLRINTNLSRARAKAVVDYLVDRGISQARLEYEGYADSQPVAPNTTAEGREKNRRVEFKVLSK